MTDAYSMVRVEGIDPAPSDSSGTDHVDLVEAMGCTEMRPEVWYLSEGDAMSFHQQAEQEELYYVLRGPGRIKIGPEEEIHDVPAGTALRTPPETPRQIRNDTGGEHVWLIVGAPPVEDDGRPPFDG